MTREIGATLLDGGRCSFRVWAPRVRSVDLHVPGPPERTVRMEAEERGYHAVTIDGVTPGVFYAFRLDGGPDRPDPASRHQPEGVHGPSAVVDPAAHLWDDGAWSGLALESYVLYELHVGTFTREGTFDAVVPYLDELQDLGITAIEIMPVAQCPGRRNWGYDGVQPFAVQDSYGGPQGLKRLVDACHARGVAAVLDVVYNHLGPEGNYLGEFGDYFSGSYRTPWGPALNFDGPGSDEVRAYFLRNALLWIDEYHFDALRLDAIHGILDMSARPFLQELADVVHARAAALDRRVHLIAESDLNDIRVLRPAREGGYGHDAQWNDDFHHALHALLTGEREGYYRDFGEFAHLEKAFAEGFVLSGGYSIHRDRTHGVSSSAIEPSRLVVFAQNHDQIGNRAAGDRLSRLVPFESLKLAAGAVVLSPYLPLIFMGEEYGETAPFLYFISHSDPDLVEAVRRGRREEFAAFGWDGELPDPQDQKTFERSRLDHTLREKGTQAILRRFYAELLKHRRERPALRRLTRDGLVIEASARESLLKMQRGSGREQVVVIFNFGRESALTVLPDDTVEWRALLDSSDRQWNGPGGAGAELAREGARVHVELRPRSFVLLARD